MPYTASNAPDHVPASKKAQWAKIWNSAYDAAKKAGMSDKDAEAKAFAEANGVIKKETKSMSKSERSYLSLEVTEFRAEKEGDKSFITGYASVYDQPTEKMGFREVVKPTAFTRALKEKQDVRVLFNHDPSAILGRTTAGTATLSSDTKGLKFRCEMPNTTTGRDVMESIKRGDISQCSFGFRAVKQAWVNTTDPNDKTKTISTRELHDVDLGDVSPVTYPAYDGTSVNARMEQRAYFPDGVPDEVTEHLNEEARAIKFLVTESDGTTHLPVTGEDGKPDHHLMGAAWAALHGGYRGRKYAGPNKDEAIAKLTAMYKSEGQPTPTEQKSDEVSEETRNHMKMQLALAESSMK
jgi:HK97 family phage prohead protease